MNAVLYLSALNHYNASLFEDESRNAMLESVELFQEIIRSKWFRLTETVLFLTKDDLFRIELKDKEIPLTVCFSKEADWPIEDEWYNGKNYKFDDTLSQNENDDIFEQCYHSAIEFIKQLFDKRKHEQDKRTLFKHVISLLDENDVKNSFLAVQKIVIKSNSIRNGPNIDTIQEDLAKLSTELR